MKQVNNTIIKSSPTLSMSADAQGHIRAEAVRFTQLTGAVTSDDDALEYIVGQHAQLHCLISNEAYMDDPSIDSVGEVVDAIERGTLMLVDAKEHLALYRFKVDVLDALQDPKTYVSSVALHSRIGMLGVANGWWVKAGSNTGANV